MTLASRQMMAVPDTEPNRGRVTRRILTLTLAIVLPVFMVQVTDGVQEAGRKSQRLGLEPEIGTENAGQREVGLQEYAAALLKKLKTADGRYRSGLTARGRMRASSVWDSEAPLSVSKFRYTWSNKRQALDQHYQPPAPAGISKMTKLLMLDDIDLLAQSRSYVTTNAQIDVEPPGGPTYIYFLRSVRWTVGRGFGEHIETLTEASTPDTAGLVTVTGRGWCEPNQRGKWQLKIEPRATYMVREAKFYRENEIAPWLIMSNEGLKRNGDCYYPEKGTLTLAASSPLSWVRWVTFDEVSRGRDDQLLAELRRHFSNPPPDSWYNDSRTDPPMRFRIIKN